MIVFVTVGSTKFDTLIETVLSEPFIEALHAKEFTRLVVQCGDSSCSHTATLDHGSLTLLNIGEVEIEIWKYKPNLEEEYKRADLVISHAGSGTILEVLRLRKPLIVVPNPTLLDNHQEELAKTLANLGHLETTTIRDLPNSLASFDAESIVPFPEFDGAKFARIMDEEMGFI
ncbi:glycosyltransferase family 1 protein [Amanita thiersii Skay4041]|uniref:UDP-N-acetylglucosamine transferase subunit ALG13 n=1 Tax=Amanita thiersii Skay4041 TaxID=703135 RepID=A0A2A9NN90_9AGAR|nr:glycosyltransferase family 1 protein [Amanita thiersii Skay4041]